MRTPLQAMLWELWRTSRLELLFRVGIHVFFILFLCGFTAETGVTEGTNIGEANVLRGVIILMLVSGCVFSITWLASLDNQHIGFSFRLGFSRPVSTTALVLVPMIYLVSTAVVGFLFSATLYGTLSGIFIPLPGLASIVACLVTCFIAASWSPTSMAGKWIGTITVAIALIGSYTVFHIQRQDPEPWILAMGKSDYFVLAWQYYAVFLVTCAIAAVVTVIGVDRQRHGDDWEIGTFILSGVTRFRAQPKALASPATKPFTGRVAAQIWYEMRRFGCKMLLIGVLTPLLPLAAVCIGDWLNPNTDFAPVMWLVIIFICPFAYQLVGSDEATGLRRKQGATELSVFDATRSMPNGQLIAIKLLVIAVCSLIGFVWMGMTAGLHSTVVGNWDSWDKIGETTSAIIGDVPGYWWLVGISNALLLYVSSSSMLLAFGLWLPLYPTRYFAGVVVAFFHIVLAVWDAKNGWALQPLWIAYGYLFSVVIFIGCIFALRKALITRAIGKRLFGCAFCLWLIYIGSSLAIYVKASPSFAIPTPVLALSISLLLVPLAATAIAPLALASHRHG